MHCSAQHSGQDGAIMKSLMGKTFLAEKVPWIMQGVKERGRG